MYEATFGCHLVVEVFHVHFWLPKKNMQVLGLDVLVMSLTSSHSLQWGELF
jgi:hypothetical protein